MNRYFPTLLFVLACLCLGAQEPQRLLRARPLPAAGTAQEPRVALVIGNAAYREAPLVSSVSDARAVADALQECGFAVTRVENASLGDMRESIRTFGLKIAKGGVGLFYYEGHGLQVEGRNFLIPVGAEINRPDDVEGESVPVEVLLGKLGAAHNRLNILILDASHGQPSGAGLRGLQPGLAPLEAPAGTCVALAVGPGKVAADGAGTGGGYAQALVRQLKTPGLKLDEVLKRTRAEVQQGSGQKQTPWEALASAGDFVFRPAPAAAPSPAPTPSPAAAVATLTAATLTAATPKPVATLAAPAAAIPSAVAVVAAPLAVAAKPVPAPAAAPAPAPAPGAAASRVGGLKVIVNAPDCRITVDGLLKGTAGPGSPLNLRDLPAGKVRLAAQAPGYLPAEQELTIPQDQWVTARLVLEKAAPGQAPPPPRPAAPTPGQAAAPAPAAAASSGNLMIHVNAMGATISINGTRMGLASPGSPLNVTDFPAGEVEISAKAEGYREHSQRVTVRSGEWIEVELILAMASN